MQNSPLCPEGEETPYTLLIKQDWDTWYPRYLSSDAWKDKRRLVLSRDGGICRECRNVAYEVHHLNYSTVGNESLEDLISLCRRCHTKKHRR